MSDWADIVHGVSPTPPPADPCPASDLRFYLLYPAPIAPKEKQRVLKQGAASALAKTAAVAFVATALPLTSYGSMATAWEHLVLFCGGNSTDSGSHVVAAFVAAVGYAATWIFDPGKVTGRHDDAHVFLRAKHYTARVARWAVIVGSFLVLPITLGFIQTTTGAHP